MLTRLRIQLTLLYLLVAMSLVALTGVGSYTLIKFFFLKETDLALQYKMATQFRQYGFDLPDELVRSEQNWSGGNSRLVTIPTAAHAAEMNAPVAELAQGEVLTQAPAQPGAQAAGDDGEDEDSSEDADSHEDEDESEEEYDSQLASIFVLPIDASGQAALDQVQAWQLCVPSS
jgi:hypothetical protein